MSDETSLPSRSEVRFSDREAREILRRATELEARPALPAPAGSGGELTLSQLQEIAREVGIDPRTVRHAALARLPEPPRSMGDVLRGGPTLRSHRVHLPGRLPVGARRTLADALDRVFDTDGSVEAEPSTAPDGPGPPSLVWSEDHTQGRTRISIGTGGDGGTELLVRADRRGWAAALNLAGLASGIGAGALMLASLGSGLAAVATGVVVWRGLVRVIWRPYSRRLGRRLEAAVAAVAAQLDEPVGRPDEG